MARARKTVNIAEAKAKLPELVERAAGGEEIVLARNGKPKARLVPLDERRPHYVMGAGKGKWPRSIDLILSEPLPQELTDQFYDSPIAPRQKRKKL